MTPLPHVALARRRRAARPPRARRWRRRSAPPRAPARRSRATTSASTVGLPRLSRISRAWTSMMVLMIARMEGTGRNLAAPQVNGRGASARNDRSPRVRRRCRRARRVRRPLPRRTAPTRVSARPASRSEGQGVVCGRRLREARPAARSPRRPPPRTARAGHPEAGAPPPRQAAGDRHRLELERRSRTSDAAARCPRVARRVHRSGRSSPARRAARASGPHRCAGTGWANAGRASASGASPRRQASSAARAPPSAPVTQSAVAGARAGASDRRLRPAQHRDRRDSRPARATDRRPRPARRRPTRRRPDAASSARRASSSLAAAGTVSATRTPAGSAPSAARSDSAAAAARQPTSSSAEPVASGNARPRR